MTLTWFFTWIETVSFLPSKLPPVALHLLCVGDTVSFFFFFYFLFYFFAWFHTTSGRTFLSLEMCRCDGHQTKLPFPLLIFCSLPRSLYFSGFVLNVFNFIEKGEGWACFLICICHCSECSYTQECSGEVTGIGGTITYSDLLGNCIVTPLHRQDIL